MGEKKRLKKYKREKGAFSKMQIQRRDTEILKSLADYRFLTSEQIVALYGESERNIKLRLQKLYHNRFLDRLGHYPSYPKPQGHMVYGIANRGADLLSEYFPDFERTTVDWLTKNKETSQRYIAHRLMISNFRVVLNLALRSHKDANLVQWQQGTELKDHVTIEDRKKNSRKIAIVPDGFFTIEDRNDTMYFFLEADRSNEDNRRFFFKMRAYWRWWVEKGHERKFGIESFRVLTVCISDKRKNNLRKVTKEADDEKKGSLMFWFCTEEAFGLSDPQQILKPIWQTPKDDHFHTLLE